GPDDVNPDLVRSALITYLEGYQWDAPKARDTMRKAAETARAAGRQVALSLSDPFCVDRHRTEFHDLMCHYINILFANETEIMSFYQVPAFSDALQAVRTHSAMAVLTRSERGAVIATTDAVHAIDAEPVARVIDTTGAGDLFAAGFLYGLVRNHPPALCARIGGLCAAEIISHFGARPKRSLADLVKARLSQLRP
ncbi:MAG: putative carbohydrate/purine kinase, partial [Rhodospirillaceae bacterium]